MRHISRVIRLRKWPASIPDRSLLFQNCCYAAAISDRAAGQVIKGNERYDIYVRLNKVNRNSVEAIQGLTL